MLSGDFMIYLNFYTISFTSLVKSNKKDPFFSGRVFFIERLILKENYI